MKLGSTHREGTRWRATWYDDAGKRHAVTAKTATDAEARRARATAGARSDQPLGTYLDWWASEHLQRQLDNNRLKGSTVAGYRRDVRLHIKPGLGDVMLTELRPWMIDDWQAELEAKGLGPRGRMKALRTLSTALSRARKRELMEHNPVADADKPRVTRQRDEVRPWTRDEQARFIAACQEHPELLGDLWLVQFGAGLRPGEVLALRTVDCRETHVRVHQTVAWHTRPPRPEFTPNKGRDDAWMPVGGQWARDALARAVAAAGERDLLFADARGLPLRVTSIGGPLTRLCALAGVERQTPHGLRHQTASALLSRGVGIWGVQQVLRHKQQSLTSDLYGHLAPDVSVEFVDVLDDLR